MRILVSILLIFLWTCGIFGQVKSSVYSGFETWPPAGWTIHTLAAGNGWIQSWQAPGEAAHGGVKSAYPAINNDKCNNWLVTPPVEVGDNYVLSFWEKFGSKEYYNKSEVYISAGRNDPLAGDYVPLYETQDTLEDWVNPVIDLTAFVGDTVFIAFRYVGTYHVWFVDDVAIGPSDHINAALTQVVSPIGVSVEPIEENISVRLANEGIGNINSVSIEWSVNGMLQQPAAFDGLDLSTGETSDLDLGSFMFSSEGNYVIRAWVISAGDIDSSNNEVVSHYAVTSIKDLRMTGITPESYYPDAGEADVHIIVENRSENAIDSAHIEWYVDEVRQGDTTITDMALMPGRTAQFQIGQYIFEKGLHSIEAIAAVVGDPDESDNRWLSTVAVDTFWESFEGRVFPPEGWEINFGVRDNINFGSPAHGYYWYTSFVDSNFFEQKFNQMIDFHFSIKFIT